MPLRNNDLYKRLCDIFDKSNVQIHDEGVATEFKRRSLGGDDAGYRFENIGLTRGEQFSISCPFCSDRTNRCYIHHLYATPEGDFTHGYIRLWRCFNEECQSDYENRKEMLRMITGGGDVGEFLIDKRVNVKPVVEKITWPGIMRPIKRLAEEEPEHLVIQWCLARNIDLRMLISGDVRYCEMGNAKHPHLTGRLVVPFWQRASKTKKIEMKGWTARIVKPRNPMDPKWVHSKSPTRHIVVGIASAAKYQVSAFVEGPGDRYAIGYRAAAVLGKFITMDKAQIIANAFKRSPIKDRVAMVILDPDQSDDSIRRGEQHHIEKSVKNLASAVDCPVVPVYLPPTTDPGGLFRCYIEDCMARALWDAGFKKIAEKFDVERLDSSD